MNAQDRRFVRAILGNAPHVEAPDSVGNFGTPGSWNQAYRWPFAAEAGQQSTVYRSDMGGDDALVLTRIEGGGLAAPELGVGLDLALADVDVDVEKVYGRSSHLLGHLHAPETAPATKDTVQIHFAEDLPDGNPSLGLVKVRGKLLWRDGGRHVLRVIRQMPVGWPGGDHHEADESAFTGRNGVCGEGASLHFGIPYLTPDRVLWRSAGITGLHEVTAALGAQA